MISIKTKLKDALIVEPDKSGDEREIFSPSAWCQHEFEILGMDKKPVQSNISFNKKRGTLRGLYYQEHPFCEAKLVRCNMGAAYFVVIDLRPESETYLQWISVELSEKNKRLFYVPEGLAHGFMTLRDNTEVFYQMSQYYMPEYARGIRWDDPLFGIKWPLKVSVISEKDSQYPYFAALPDRSLAF
ncbi:MAG: dTDP-4-dehydrorhamnose 3,5-epimerase [Nitrospiraceae bacterium]|nr:dTDP-4-dehydrorhamnose 3,5-epimerase [Nitrospiraceae bacterium]